MLKRDFVLNVNRPTVSNRAAFNLGARRDFLVNGKAKAKAKAKPEKPKEEGSHGTDFAAKDLSGITKLHTKYLAAASRGDLDLNVAAKHELASRGTDEKGKWSGVKKPKDDADASEVRRYAEFLTADHPFGSTPTEVLAAGASGKADLNGVAKHELAYRGQDQNGTFIGIHAARAHHFPANEAEKADEKAKAVKRKDRAKNRAAEALVRISNRGDETIELLVGKVVDRKVLAERLVNRSHTESSKIHASTSDEYFKASEKANGELKNRLQELGEAHHALAETHRLIETTGDETLLNSVKKDEKLSNIDLQDRSVTRQSRFPENFP